MGRRRACWPLKCKLELGCPAPWWRVVGTGLGLGSRVVSTLLSAFDLAPDHYLVLPQLSSDYESKCMLLVKTKIQRKPKLVRL